MRLVIDQIRGKNVNEALALLTFSKKHAAKQIAKTLQVGGRERGARGARRRTTSLDVDALYVKHAIMNEGPKLKRFMPAAQGRATPIQKRTSHVEIVVGREGRASNGTEDTSDRLPPRHLQARGGRAATRTASFPALLREDELLRKYLKARLGHAAIADILIERKPGKVVVTMHTGRPGVVIGKKGAEVDKLRDELAQLPARKSASTSKRSSVPSSTRSSWPTTSRTSWRSASRSAAR